MNCCTSNIVNEAGKWHVVKFNYHANVHTYILEDIKFCPYCGKKLEVAKAANQKSNTEMAILALITEEIQTKMKDHIKEFHRM